MCFLMVTKFDDTKVTDLVTDNEKTTKENKQSKNYVNIDNLPLLFLDDAIPTGDHIEVCNEIADEAHHEPKNAINILEDNTFHYVDTIEPLYSDQ